MHVRFMDDVLLRLQTTGIINRGAEFSGLGWCRIEGPEIVVYDFLLLDLGSETWTEIPPEIILPLLERPDRDNMRVWIHAHPIGNGIPGPHNWSKTDHDTCTREPLGGPPELVGWSVALVRTPGGWVGRIDNHVTKKVRYLKVLPDLSTTYKEVDAVRERKRKAHADRFVESVASQFADEDLELLDIADRETLKEWIQAEFGGDIDDMIASPWYRDEDGYEWYEPERKRTWTTPDTGISSGRKA